MALTPTSKAFQLQPKMIREGLQTLMDHPTEGPLFRTALLAFLGGSVGGGTSTETAEERLTAIRDAAAAQPVLATKVFNSLLAQVVSIQVAQPGDQMVINNTTPPEALADPWPSILTFEAPAVIEDMIEGKHALSMPATALNPDVTAGPEFVVVETASNDRTIAGYAFDAASAERVTLKYTPPKSVKPTTFTVRLSFTNATTSTQGVAWDIAAVAVSAGESLDQALGTEVTVTATCVAGAYMQQRTLESGAVTPGGTWAEGDTLFISIARDPAHASDTLAQDAILTDVEIFFQTDQLTDA